MPPDSGAPSPGRARTERARLGLLAGAALFVPMLCVPAPAGLSAAGWRTAAVGVLMAVWWMTEALPTAATSLLPLVLFPILGVIDVEAAAAPYANPLVFLFLGGFMLASAFLSPWISNTATALLMLPIALSVIDLANQAVGDRADADRVTGGAAGSSFAPALLLGVAYACSIGGMGTLVGSPTNALLAGFLLETYGTAYTFLEWLAVGLPVAVVGLAITWIVLTRWVFPLGRTALPGGDEHFRRERTGLGEDPVHLLVPATLAASCAFMMPVATPPNAIVYGSGAVTVPQMVKAGLWLNLVFIVLLTAAGVGFDGLAH